MKSVHQSFFPSHFSRSCFQRGESDSTWSSFTEFFFTICGRYCQPSWTRMSLAEISYAITVRFCWTTTSIWTSDDCHGFVVAQVTEFFYCHGVDEDDGFVDRNAAADRRPFTFLVCFHFRRRFTFARAADWRKRKSAKLVANSMRYPP